MKVVIDGNKTKTTRGGAKELLDHISELFTKEEIIAMLTELQLEIEEVARCPYTECIGGDCPFQDCMIHKGRVVSLIQSKINSLKEE